LKAGEELKLITDHCCVVESITEYCKKSGLRFEIVEPMNGIWELYVKRI
ncbi:MAG: sulfurtransferase TusA family protein, partial [Acetivibrio ethanolgignens]